MDRTKEHKERHKRKCANEAPDIVGNKCEFKCKYCTIVSNRWTAIAKHLQNDHGGLIETSRKTKLIACYVCQKKMEDLTQLRRHLINHNEHKFGRQSPKIKKEEFTAKFLEFSKKHFKAPKPSFSISSILSEA